MCLTVRRGGEFRTRSDIRGAADLVLMARDEHAVGRADEVGLDEIGALLDGDHIGRERVLGEITARPAMGDEDGFR